MNVWGTFVEHVGELFEEHLGGGKSTRRYCDVGGPADCKPPPTRPAQPTPEELPRLPLMVILQARAARLGALRFDY